MAERTFVSMVGRMLETPDGKTCLQRSRASAEQGDFAAAYDWLGRVADSGASYVVWASAATALAKLEAKATPAVRRSVRVAIAGSYTTSQFGPLLKVAALRRGIQVEIYEVGFDL